MPTYHVQWEIDLDEADPIQAAVAALAIQRDPTSTATVFDVIDGDGMARRVDLQESIREIAPAPVPLADAEMQYRRSAAILSAALHADVRRRILEAFPGAVRAAGYTDVGEIGGQPVIIRFQTVYGPGDEVLADLGDNEVLDAIEEDVNNALDWIAELDGVDHSAAPYDIDLT